MSLTEQTSQPQQSAPPAPPPSEPSSALETPVNGAEVTQDAPVAPASEPTPTPSSEPSGDGQPAGGANPDSPPAGDDWSSRIARMAGEDEKAIEALSRYKSEEDFVKAHMELRRKIGERPSMVTELDPDATPEQVADYRKAKGVPEEATLEAYEVQLPDGYEMPEGEKDLVNGVIADMHAKHMGKAEVGVALDHYFKAQTASIQAMREQTETLKSQWQNELKDKYGHRDYDAKVDAGKAYLDSVFGEDQDSKNALLYAQLPGGGIVGDHPAFFEMVSELAGANGLNDKIEANAFEAGGRSLAEQHAEIKGWRHTDPAKYEAASVSGGKLEKLIELRLKRGEIDESGNEKSRF